MKKREIDSVLGALVGMALVIGTITYLRSHFGPHWFHEIVTIYFR